MLSESVSQPPSSEASDEMEKLILSIRSEVNGDVTILSSPSNTESSYTSIEASSNQPFDNTHTDKEDITKGKEKDINTDDRDSTSSNRKQIIIITKPLKEGEGPLPLPSWQEVPTQPSDPQELELWRKDNAVRKYWTSKYPFLNEHYEQINLSSPKTIEKAIELQSVDNTNVSSQGNTNPSTDNNLGYNTSHTENETGSESSKHSGEKSKTKPDNLNTDKANMLKDKEVLERLSPEEKEFIKRLNPEYINPYKYTKDYYIHKFDESIVNTIKTHTNYYFDNTTRIVKLSGDNTYELHDVQWVVNNKDVKDSVAKKIDSQNILI